MSIPPIEVLPSEWKIIQDILTRHVPTCAVWAFGSRAKRCAKKYSDLDLVIINDSALGLSVTSALAEDFSESDLPWKVDIIEWFSTSESFRKIIERDKVVIQA